MFILLPSFYMWKADTIPSGVAKCAAKYDSDVILTAIF